MVFATDRRCLVEGTMYLQLMALSVRILNQRSSCLDVAITTTQLIPAMFHVQLHQQTEN